MLKLLFKLLPQLQYMPGLTQRIGFMLCLVWYFALALWLLRGNVLTEKAGWNLWKGERGEQKVPEQDKAGSGV